MKAAHDKLPIPDGVGRRIEMPAKYCFAPAAIIW